MKIMKAFLVLLALVAFTFSSIPMSYAAVAAPAKAAAKTPAAKAKAKTVKKAAKPVKGKQHGIPRVAPATPAPAKPGA